MFKVSSIVYRLTNFLFQLTLSHRFRAHIMNHLPHFAASAEAIFCRRQSILHSRMFFRARRLTILIL